MARTHDVDTGDERSPDARASDDASRDARASDERSRDARDERPARAADVAEICAALPETELGVSWGDRPTWQVPRGAKGRGFCLERAPDKHAIDPESGAPYDDLLVIRVPDVGAKAALVDDPGSPFFTVHHFRSDNAVLVQQSRLHEVSVAELREILTDAWLTVAPKRLATAYLASLSDPAGS